MNGPLEKAAEYIMALQTKAGSSITLCESGRRYQLQYRFVNPPESDNNKFPKSISITILRSHGRPFEKINIENEAFAL